MWKNIDENMWDTISLHDCVISEILITKSDVCFKFNDGFWILSNHHRNIYNKILRSRKSEILIRNAIIEDVTLKKSTKFLFIEKTIEKKITLFDFIKINNKHKFNIIDEIYLDNYVLYDIISYNGECRLKIKYDNIIYYWNDIDENREW